MHHTTAFVGYDDAAELGAVVVAMFAVLVLAGLWLIVTFAGGLFRHIPFVGGPIANAFDTAARALRNATLGTWHGVLWSLSRLFRSVSALIRNLGHAMTAALHAVEHAVEHQAYTVIPREIRHTRAFAHHVASLAYHSAVDYARFKFQQAEAGIRAERAGRKAADQSLNQSLLRTIRVTAANLGDRIAALRADTWGWTRQAVARADRQFQQAEADLKAGDRATATQVIHHVDNEARDGWAPVWAGIMAGVAGAIQVAGEDFPQITRQLRAIATEAPTTLTQAEAAAARAVPPMMTALEQCVLPQCRDLGPLRSLMHTLGSALFQLALLAWIVQMIVDPVTWAHETYGSFRPLIDAELGLVKALTGQ